MTNQNSDINLDLLRDSPDYDLPQLYHTLIPNDNDYDNIPFTGVNLDCKYYAPDQFNELSKEMRKTSSYFHLNCQGLQSHWDNFHNLLCELHSTKFSFDFIGISEIFHVPNTDKLSLPGYHPLKVKTRNVVNGYRGGVGLYVNQNINFHERTDLTVFIPHIIESFFIEIENEHSKNEIVGVIYRPNTAPKADIDIFMENVNTLMNLINSEQKPCVIMGDVNINLLKFSNHQKTNEYLENTFQSGFIPTITKPTRVTTSSATLIDHIYTNDLKNKFTNGIILTDVADHFGIFHIKHMHSHNASGQKLKQIRIINEQNKI